MTRAIIYARVSTEDQARRGYSLPSQLDECRRYCEREGYTIAAEFSEDESGAKLDRPELTKARDMLRTGQADALIVLASDRLTRSLAHHLLLRDEMRRAGVELIYVQRGGRPNITDTQTAQAVANNAHQLFIDGGSTNDITVSGGFNSTAVSTNFSAGGHTYNVYTPTLGSIHATLLIQNDSLINFATHVHIT